MSSPLKLTWKTLPNLTTVAELHAVVPAAGVGARMGAIVPKQYLSLAGEPILALTLRRLLTVPNLSTLVVTLSPDDTHWNNIDSSLRMKVRGVEGGSERALSVLAGLNALLKFADPDDLVLVHDAARPCVRLADINNLISRVCDDPLRGGLLACPVRDTMKRGSASDHVIHTEPRENLWHALTPQLFQLRPLRDAIVQAGAAGVNLTDESSAMEWAGLQPLLVQGSDDNIKVTRPDDIKMAEQYLGQQNI